MLSSAWFRTERQTKKKKKELDQELSTRDAGARAFCTVAAHSSIRGDRGIINEDGASFAGIDYSGFSFTFVFLLSRDGLWAGGRIFPFQSQSK